MENLILTQIGKEEFQQLISDAVKTELASAISHNSNPQPEYINRNEACVLLGISKPTIISWGKEGILPCYRIGSRVRYKRDEVLNSLKQIKTSK